MVSSFAHYKSLEQAREAIEWHYRCQIHQAYRECMALGCHLVLRLPDARLARALRVLHRNYVRIRRQLKVERNEMLAAADIWAFEDPDCEYGRSRSDSEADERSHNVSCRERWHKLLGCRCCTAV